MVGPRVGSKARPRTGGACPWRRPAPAMPGVGAPRPGQGNRVNGGTAEETGLPPIGRTEATPGSSAWGPSPQSPRSCATTLVGRSNVVRPEADTHTPTERAATFPQPPLVNANRWFQT